MGYVIKLSKCDRKREHYFSVFNPFSVGTDFRRQNLTSMILLYVVFCTNHT